MEPASSTQYPAPSSHIQRRPLIAKAFCQIGDFAFNVFGGLPGFQPIHDLLELRPELASFVSHFCHHLAHEAPDALGIVFIKIAERRWICEVFQPALFRTYDTHAGDQPLGIRCPTVAARRLPFFRGAVSAPED